VPSGQRYTAQTGYRIEPDASSASYFFAAAAVTGGTVRIPDLSPDALQGDVRFATEVLAAMGCTVTHDAGGITVSGPPPGQLRGIDRDMSAISDTSLTLAAIAPFANSPTTVRNIAHSRRQECDRIEAACTELTRLGVSVEEHPDGYTIYPASRFRPAVIETYHDHRVAMSFALIGLRIPGVTIHNPACVAKTFPDYWQRLARLYGEGIAPYPVFPTVAKDGSEKPTDH
jgi:3-phosphoshikimate 1-carboxyvinyltransferase